MACSMNMQAFEVILSEPTHAKYTHICMYYYIMQKHLRCKKMAWPSKVESYLRVNACKRLATTRSDITMQPRLSILNT